MRRGKAPLLPGARPREEARSLRSGLMRPAARRAAPRGIEGAEELLESRKQ